MSQWDRAQQVFREALDRDPAEREAFLDEVCAGDQPLREEVASLLAFDGGVATDFLAAGDAGGEPNASEPEPLLGQTVGRYRIVRLIASGGMGTVYEAVQEQPERAVALKVMRGARLGPSLLRRFELESHLLARLRHPGIAQVYEAGTHEGDGAQPVPFFAMELVPDARPINRYAEQMGLPLRERLDLFLQVCDAVQHGHQRGIIHRDLKPANILVDPDGRVKVIDFGVARVTDADVAITTLRTDVGQLVGTLQYMSPEQCQADPLELDTRSDVYALGVVLYELLTGALPYDVSCRPIPSAARVICEEPPIAPQLLSRTFRGDLGLVMLRAMEKDRDRRYQSAADLARDVRHYLGREPIEARPPSVWMSIARWLARHPVVTTAAAASVVALGIVLGTIAAIQQARSMPREIVLSEDGKEARLLALSGHELHVWTAKGGGIYDAEIVDAPRELGGGRRAVLV